MRRSPCLKQHLREKSFARNKEKTLFFAVEHLTFFLFAPHFTFGGSKCRIQNDLHILARLLQLTQVTRNISLLPPYEQPFQAKRKKVKYGAAKREEFFACALFARAKSSTFLLVLFACLSYNARVPSGQLDRRLCRCGKTARYPSTGWRSGQKSAAGPRRGPGSGDDD